MSSNRYGTRWRIASLVLALVTCTTACTTAQPTTPLASEALDSKPPGGACQTSNGLVSNGNIVYHCVLPGQSFINCPQHVCQRCNNGTFGAEYACLLR
jgi:hypothetical protein